MADNVNKQKIFTTDAWNEFSIGISGLSNKSKLTNIAYGTCSTAAATAAKEITISNNYDWKLDVGSIIIVKFSATNTASNPTFNVNNTGAKSVWYNTAKITTSSLGYAGTANRPMMFMYDGTNYVFISWSYDTNSTYSNVSLGQGYATQSNTSSATAITATLSSYALSTGGIVAVKFTYDVLANSTLNINGKGAKNIFYRGAKITADIVKSGDIATFIYDGTQYQLLSIDKDANTTYSKATTSALGLVKIGYTESGKNYPVELNSEGQMYVNVPWTDNNTTYANYKGASSAVAGTAGLVPAATTATYNKFLRGDGTWQTPTNTDTKVAQTELTSNSDRSILFASNNTTASATTGTYKSTKLKYNPSTDILTVGTVSGNLSGTATFATMASKDASGNTITSVYETKTNVTSSISTHNTSNAAHNDIRDLINSKIQIIKWEAND